MATTPEAMLQRLREDRTLLQCSQSMGEAWQVVWMHGPRRQTSTNGQEALRRLLTRKRSNLNTLYPEGSDLWLHMAAEWASLAWVLEQIDAAAGAEG